MFPKVFINEEGNDEAVKAMNDVYNVVNGSSSIGVTLYIEYIDGKKIEAKEFLGKCKYIQLANATCDKYSFYVPFLE